MGPMRCTESVVYIKVGKTGQLLGKVLVVGFLFRMKAQILLGRHFGGFRSNALRTKPNILGKRVFLIEQHAQALSDRFQTHLRIWLSLRPPQVRSQNQPRPLLQCIFDRRQSLSNAGLISNQPILERNVEVYAHEDTLIMQR